MLSFTALIVVLPCIVMNLNEKGSDAAAGESLECIASEKV